VTTLVGAVKGDVGTVFAAAVACRLCWQDRGKPCLTNHVNVRRHDDAPRPYESGYIHSVRRDDAVTAFGIDLLSTRDTVALVGMLV
jgi:hypothetical protein